MAGRKVYLFDCYGDLNHERASAFFEHVADAGPTHRLEMAIHSPGGEVNSAWAIYNMAVSKFGNRITTIATGDCSSCAILLFMLGSRRVVFPSSRFGFHSVHAEGGGGVSTLSLAAIHMKLVQDDVMSEIARKAGLDMDVLAPLVATTDTRHVAATQLVELGLATELQPYPPVPREKKRKRK